MKALVACVVLLAAAFAVSVEPARGCSCIPPDPWSFLKQADGAFVGRLVSRRETDLGQAVLLFDVERSVKGRIGKTVEVMTPSSGASCGIETTVGRRIGLFLEREGDGWLGTLCLQVAPEDLLAAAALPAPNGKGPVALFVGGRFGPARMLALDGQGRTLAYGLGRGNALAYSVCPGGRRVAELVGTGAPYLKTSYAVAIRELPTLRLIRQQRLSAAFVGPLRCLSAGGGHFVVFSGSGPDLDQRAQLVRAKPGDTTTIWQGWAWYTSFRGRTAYVQAFPDSGGTAIVAVDLRTGATRTIGTVARNEVNELTPNAAGTLLAGDSSLEGLGDPRLLVIDLHRRPISFRSVQQWDGGDVLWLRNDQFAYVAGSEILVYSAALRLTRRLSGWNAQSTTLLGSRFFGVGRFGKLLRMKLASGQVVVVRRLPGRPSLIISASG